MEESRLKTRARRVTCAALGCALAVSASLAIARLPFGGSALAAEDAAQEYAFDESNIVSTVGIMSDVHIGFGTDAGSKFTKALKNLKAYAGGNPSAVMFDGDLADTMYAKDGSGDRQLAEFKQLLEAEFPDRAAVPVLYSLGNHDTFYDTFPLTEHYIESFGESYFAQDESDSQAEIGCRKMKINDTYFLTVPYDDKGYSLPQVAAEWLGDQLETITTAEPEAYVVVLSHAPSIDTVWLSSRDGCMNNGLKEVLSDYPQVICFTGHVHSDLNNARSIMSTDFTTVMCGSTNYISSSVMFPEETAEVLAGGGSVNGLANIREYSQFVIYEEDTNGNVRIARIDSHNEGKTGYRLIGYWYLDKPDSEGTHLTRYSMDRANTVEKPSFAQGSALTLEQKSSTSVAVTVPLAGGENLWTYHVQVKHGNNKVYDDYFTLNVYEYGYGNLPETQHCTVTGVSFAAGETYTVSVIACDVWGNKSQTLSESFTAVEFDVNNYYLDMATISDWNLYGYCSNVSPEIEKATGYEVWNFLNSTAVGSNREVIDPYITYNLEPFGIPASNGFIVLRFYANASKLVHGNIYVTSTEEASAAFTNYSFGATNDWRSIVMSLEELQNLKDGHREGYYSTLRIDVGDSTNTAKYTYPQNSSVKIESVAFFSTREEAEKYAGLASAPAAPVLGEVTYGGGALTAGDVLDSTLLESSAGIAGSFQFTGTQTVVAGTVNYRYKFVPNDTKTYRITFGKIALTAEEDPYTRQAAYVDFTEESGVNAIEYKNSADFRYREEGYTEMVLPIAKVNDPYFTVLVQSFALDMKEFRYAVWRVKTNVDLGYQVRFTTKTGYQNNPDAFWAFGSKTVPATGDYFNVVFDLLSLNGIAGYTDAQLDRLTRLRFDVFSDANTDDLELNKGEYFYIDSVAIFSNEDQALAYGGISSVRADVGTVSYEGTVAVGESISASALKASTDTKGTFEIASSAQTFVKGINTVDYCFTPISINRLPYYGTLTFDLRDEPVLTVTYNGTAKAGEKISLLDFEITATIGETAIDGVFTIEESTFVAGAQEYHYTFVPDSEDYKTVSGTISITARSDEDDKKPDDGQKGGCAGFGGGMAALTIGCAATGMAAVAVALKKNKGKNGSVASRANDAEKK